MVLPETIENLTVSLKIQKLRAGEVSEGVRGCRKSNVALPQDRDSMGIGLRAVEVAVVEKIVIVNASVV